MGLRIVTVRLTCDTCGAAAAGALDELEGQGWGVHTWSAPLSEDADCYCPDCEAAREGGAERAWKAREGER